MRLSHSSYQKYIKSLNTEIKGEPFYSPLLLNNHTFLFPFIEKSKEVLVILLNPKTPVVFKTKSDLFFSSFENSFLQKFRKNIGKIKIININLEENDLVVKIDVESLDEGGRYTFVCELIPTKPNLIILNEDNKVVDYYFKSKTRVLNLNEQFTPLINEKLIDGEQEISSTFLNELFQQEIEIRSKEKFANFEKYLTSKIKSVKRKIIAIENDVKIASKSLEYQGFADEIFAMGLNLKSHQNSIKIGEKELKLDQSKTILKNIQNFYKKTKKAKETIARSEANIMNAKNELKQFEDIYDSFLKADEKEKEKIASVYSNSKNKKELVATSLNRPWKVNLNGTIIYFGRNASQNDYLSFAMKLDREFTWLHIKDKSGAHLVIANKKPTDSELLTACEISLLCSRTASGEVSYTKKKNVRRGHVLGEAILKNYSVIKINSIRKETIELFEKAVRLN